MFKRIYKLYSAKDDKRQQKFQALRLTKEKEKKGKERKQRKGKDRKGKKRREKKK